MAGPGCQSTYKFADDGDRDGATADLFDKCGGEWNCPRDAVEGTDKCPFHLREEERQRAGIGAESLSELLVAELEGRTDMPADRRGELVDVAVGTLRLEDVAVPASGSLRLVDSNLDELVVADSTLENECSLEIHETTICSDSVAGRGTDTGGLTVSDSVSGEISIRQSTVGKVTVCSTELREGLTISGSECELTGLTVKEGVIADGPVNITEGAQIRQTAEISGSETVVEGIIVERGAQIGPRQVPDADIQHLRVVDGASVEYNVAVFDSGTKVNGIKFDRARALNCSVENSATVLGTITIANTALETVEMRDVAGQPVLDVTGETTDIEAIKIEETTLQQSSIQKGATVSDGMSLEDATIEGTLTVTNSDTTVATLELSGGSVNAVTRITDGASVTAFNIGGTATLALDDAVDETSALVVCDAGTTVSTISVESDATVDGLSVDERATVGSLCVNSTAAWPISVTNATVTGQLKIDNEQAALPSETMETAALQLADTAIGSLEISNGIVPGGITIDGGTVGDISLADGIAVGGVFELGSNTSISGDVELTAPLESVGSITFRGDTTVGGDLVCTGSRDQPITIGSDDGICIRESTIEGTVRLEGGLTSVDTALRVTEATLEGGLTTTGGAIGGEIVIHDAAVGADIQLGPETTVLGALWITDATAIEGMVSLGGCEIEGLTVTTATIGRGLSVAGDTTVQGSVRLTHDTDIGGDVVVGVQPDADSGQASPVGSDRPDNSPQLPLSGGNIETAIGGEFVLGAVAESHPSAGGVSVAGSVALVGTAAVDGGVRLGDAVVKGDLTISDVPEIGGLGLIDATVSGKLVVTGSHLLALPDEEAAVDIRESVIGEDIRVVDRTCQRQVGEIILVDTIVRGKVRVDNAEIAALTLIECRVGESVWIGPTSRRREDGVHDLVPGRTTISGPFTVRATPITENILVRGATLERVALDDALVDGRIAVSDTIVDGRVSLERTHIGQALSLSASQIGALVVDGHTAFDELRLESSGAGGHPPTTETGRHPSDDDLWIREGFDLGGIGVDGDLTVDCAVGSEGTRGGVSSLAEATVGGKITLCPRLYGHSTVDLTAASLPRGELHVTQTTAASRSHLWYDLTEATLGDVTVVVEDGESDPLDHLRFLKTEFDGFRFGALDCDVTTADTQLHTVPERPGTAGSEGQQREWTDRTRRGAPGLFATLTQFGAKILPLGVTHNPNDPPPERLERTYLNAKKGASRTGDEHIAGHFFTLEKRYRRRVFWERLCLHEAEANDGPEATEPASGPTSASESSKRLVSGRLVARIGAYGSSFRTFRRWTTNVTLDLIAVYGESSRRVVEFSALVIAIFAGLFAVLLDQPPYGDQYLGSGVLSPELAEAIQPLTLSIESFVTLVLVGPADQRLTPFVHLLGQVEGFLGVFLVALFVFTLTRSIHR